MKQIILMVTLLLNTGNALMFAQTDTPPQQTMGEPANPGMIPVFNPFVMHMDPMERLLLINFEKDPDTLYVAFEPQVFADEVNGSGHIVIGWRVDGRIDVYHQRGMSLDPMKYDIVGKGLAGMIECDMEQASYEIREAGLDVHYVFHDIHQRRIVLKILEQHPRKRKPFGLLAPMGAAAENPSAMPMVLLHDFYFVRQKHSQIIIAIDGNTHQPDKMPMMLDGKRMYFVRYSPDPLIVTLNPAAKGPLTALEVPVGAAGLDTEHYSYGLSWTDGAPAFTTMTRKHPKHPVTMRFSAPFPNISTMKPDTMVTGQFEIEGDRSTGIISGHYTVEHHHGVVAITMIPSGGWKPRPTKCSLRIMYKAIKVFTQWPETYRWEALITPGDDQELSIHSFWTRTLYEEVKIFD